MIDNKVSILIKVSNKSKINPKSILFEKYHLELTAFD